MTTKLSHIKSKLSNGLTVLYLHTKDDPISAGHLFFPGGTSQEALKEKGVSNLLWSLFAKGSEHQSARKMAEQIESLGASVSAGAGQDYASVSFYSLSDTFRDIIDITAEALFAPLFRQEEVQKEKKALIAAIQSKKESIFTVTHEFLNHHLYSNHPYALPSSGKVDTVERLGGDHLNRWHRQSVLPNQAILSIASNQPFDSFLPFIEKFFGPNTWEPGDISWQKALPSPEKPTEEKKLTQKTDFEQAYFMMAYPAPSAQSRDYIPIKVLNSLLGGGMSARLFQSLREKQGLAYDVGSFYPTKIKGSGFYFYLGLQESNITDAKKGILKEVERLKNEKVSTEELRQIKNYIKGTFVLDHQTNSQRAHYLAWWEILGLNSYFDSHYLPEVEAVTPEQIQSLSKTLFNKPSVMVETHPKKS